jgi:flagellar basal-body rod modification protein FlgD
MVTTVQTRPMQSSVSQQAMNNLIQGNGSSSSSSASSPDASKPQQQIGGISPDYQSFLKLLTAQMRNQDPTKPTDSTQFVAQLAQFSSVEQQMAANQKLDKLAEALSTSTVSAAASVLGRKVETKTDSLVVANDGATFSYTVPEGQTKVEAVLRNEAGAVVGRIPLLTTVGEQQKVWDGKGTDGGQVPAGRYKFTVTGTNNKGDTSGLNAFARDVVKEVIDGTDGIYIVTEGKAKVKLGDVRSFS